MVRIKHKPSGAKSVLKLCAVFPHPPSPKRSRLLINVAGGYLDFVSFTASRRAAWGQCQEPGPTPRLAGRSSELTCTPCSVQCLLLTACVLWGGARGGWELWGAGEQGRGVRCSSLSGTDVNSWVGHGPGDRTRQDVSEKQDSDALGSCGFCPEPVVRW